ncbi:hypothetical protein AVEN_117884-1 [Araneus ventricosus]|uniref:Uncharacterized protein n=1 Tax=Araneus ventricosus TaxID=182803 RepID=A0A4Y2PV98_ARAVE|nr:hypothetical protein AVEN_117884-1 [Araneus ventricosus]
MAIGTVWAEDWMIRKSTAPFGLPGYESVPVGVEFDQQRKWEKKKTENESLSSRYASWSCSENSPRKDNSLETLRKDKSFLPLNLAVTRAALVAVQV